ncbi:MAG: acyl--CoA ligase [Alphaproteobacteria bacterium]|nr:acyl--CoA ligase [Alphaproteobacteria bacterium]
MTLDALLDGATDLTLGAALRRVADRLPDAPALLSDQRSLTWAALDDEVDRVASLLQSVGVAPGDVVGFLVNKRPEVVTGFLACARLGAIMAPVNFKLHPDRVRDQFETAGIRAVLTEKSRDRLLGGIVDLVPDRAKVIYVGPTGAHGDTAYDAWRGQPRLDPAAHADDPGAVCYLNYTSGTTGRPKGAQTTHRNIQHNAVATIRGLDFRPDDVFLGMFSVFAHPHELFHRSLLVGGPFVILDTMSPRVIAEAVERHRVTWMMAVPSFYEMMLDWVAPRTGGGGEGGDLADVSSLRVLESGGAYVGAETLARMEAAFGCTFMPVWGCTEATGVGLANGPDEAGRLPGATGRPVPGYTFKVVDEAGVELPRGQVGELLMRGPAVATTGYIHQPEETAALFVDGWYHTQDLVTMDEDGFVRFAGRRSEMLKIGGIRVYPLEIEKVIKDHPEIRDVVVVRAEERVRGEIARAVVSTVPGSSLDTRGLQAWCRERLAVYKVPRIVEFWVEVPKLPNGKIDKQAVLATDPDGERDDR